MLTNVHAAADLESHRLGTVALEPAGPVVAGSMGQWILTLTVGSYGIDEGGTIKLAQRFASDWEIPQFDRPTDSGYTTVSTTGAARLRPYYHAKAHERPWMKCLVIDVFDGSLAPGDTVTIVLGDRSGGGPGIRAQTFQESAHEFRMLVDPTNANRAIPLPTSPRFPVVAGQPVALVCIVSSQAETGEAEEIFVKGEDVWGNPTPAPERLDLRWQAAGNSGDSAQVEILNGRCRAATSGEGWILVQAEGERGRLQARSNPIRFTAPADKNAPDKVGELRHYWGDLHAQTAGTVGTGDEDEYFIFARDAARLDFASHQGNDFQIDDAYWTHLNATVAKYQADGQFVVFPGYEWSANSPAGGDRNVFYRREGMPIFRSSHWQIPHAEEDADTPAHPADVLFGRLRARIPLEDVLLGAHVGGRYADIRGYFDQELGPLVEVLSCWGVFEWMLWDAFDKGYVIGIMCNSDGHKGRPGAEGPGAGEFGIRGGLTCVLAPAKTRAAIWEALRRRHCYGTSGPRILLDYAATTTDGTSYLLGDVLPNTVSTVHLTAAVTGTAALESLTLYRGKERLTTVRPAVFQREEPSRRVRITWQGSRIRGRGRRVAWDGEIRLEGVGLVDVQPIAFDSYSDGIAAQGETHVQFRSATTGDADALDLWLDAPAAGRLIFDSAVGRAEFDLAALNTVGAAQQVDFGGLDMQLRIERYPEAVNTYKLRLSEEVHVPTRGRIPYWVKAVQVDGHMAWASPIYLTGKQDIAG